MENNKGKTEEQLEFLAKQAQELNMGYEMTEPQKKAEEIINEIDLIVGRNSEVTNVTHNELVNEFAINKVKGIIAEIQIMRTYEPPYSYLEMERLNYWNEVLNHLEG